MGDRVTPEDAHDWRKDRHGLDRMTRWQIAGVGVLVISTAAWVAANIAVIAYLRATEPHPICAARALYGAECSAVLAEGR